MHTTIKMVIGLVIRMENMTRICKLVGFQTKAGSLVDIGTSAEITRQCWCFHQRECLSWRAMVILGGCRSRDIGSGITGWLSKLPWEQRGWSEGLRFLEGARVAAGSPGFS